MRAAALHAAPMLRFALLWAALTAAHTPPIIFVKLHRVGGTTMQNLLARFVVNHNRTALCTTKVSDWNRASLNNMAQLAERGTPPTNTGRWPLDACRSVASARVAEGSVLVSE